MANRPQLSSNSLSYKEVMELISSITFIMRCLQELIRFIKSQRDKQRLQAMINAKLDKQG